MELLYSILYHNGEKIDSACSLLLQSSNLSNPCVAEEFPEFDLAPGKNTLTLAGHPGSKVAGVSTWLWRRQLEIKDGPPDSDDLIRLHDTLPYFTYMVSLHSSL